MLQKLLISPLLTLLLMASFEAKSDDYPSCWTTKRTSCQGGYGNQHAHGSILWKCNIDCPRGAENVFDHCDPDYGGCDVMKACDGMIDACGSDAKLSIRAHPHPQK